MAERTGVRVARRWYAFPPMVDSSEHWRISGATSIAALIGDPIEYARSPLMANAAVASLGFDLVMVPMHVAVADLARAIEGLRGWRNFRGAIITMPHKASVIPLLDHVSNQVRQAGACNVVRRLADGRLEGTLLDGEGFVAGLRHAGTSVAGTSVLLIGAGSAASAIAFALAKHGATDVAIFNRTVARAAALAARVASAYPTCVGRVATTSDARDRDLVINATAIGMRPSDPLPIEPQSMIPGTLAADIVVTSDMTPWLTVAQQHGCRVHIGRHMLAAQIDQILEFIGA